MPVRIEALQEGTVANVHVPVYQIFASDEYSRLITFLETILTQIWYPSTVATLSRRTRDLIEIGFQETADEEDHWQVDYKLVRKTQRQHTRETTNTRDATGGNTC